MASLHELKVAYWRGRAMRAERYIMESTLAPDIPECPTNEAAIQRQHSAPTWKDFSLSEHTAIRADKICAIKKGRWDDGAQDWRGVIVMDSGLEIPTSWFSKRLLEMIELDE